MLDSNYPNILENKIDCTEKYKELGESMKQISIFLIVLLIVILFTACNNKPTDTNIAPGLPELPDPGNGATHVGIVKELTWSCADQDGDDLTYTLYMGKTTSMEIVASEITDTHFLPDTLDYSQRYYWKVRANDGIETTMGNRWYFDTMAEDMPPTIPANPIPANNLTGVAINQLFRWYCYDINGDDISFDFYLGIDENLQIFAENLDEYELMVENLEFHTMYYWKIIAKSNDLITEGPVWCFETEYGNLPPDVPHTPYPHDGTTNVSTHTRLSWNCDDPEGDDLTYDIYLGTEINPPILEQGFETKTYYPENLQPSTTYYWCIDAHDANNQSLGPIWQFTTGALNLPPNVPTLPWPDDEATDESVYAMLRWTCSDPDGDALMYKVYFGIVPNLTEDNVIALGITDENYELGILEYSTTYYWKITAHDGELTTTGATWSFTTETSRR